MDVLLVAAFMLFVICIYRKLSCIYGVFVRLKIPGPKPVWILGNIHEFKDEDKLSRFKVWRAKYGDIYGYYEGFQPSIVICEPEMSKLILVKHFEKFNIRPIHNPFCYYPNEHSILNTYGPNWKSQRTAIISALSALPVETVSKKLYATSKEMVEILEEQININKEGFDVESLIDRYTLDAFSLAMFDHRTNSMRDDNSTMYRYMKVFNESSEPDNPKSGLARVYPSLVPFLQLFDGKHKEIHVKHIHEIREVIQKRRNQDQSIHTKDNILDFLLNIKIPDCETDDGHRPLTVEEIVAHVNSITGGGFSTTNGALAFVIHQLTVHQDVQQKVFEEMQCHCGLFDDPDIHNLSKLKYLQCVIDETLRVLPCAPGVTRTCSENCCINGTKFEKGMVVRIMLCALYDDDNIYPDPKAFHPERFTDSEREKRHPNTFLPFGQGPRICPGFKFATVLIKVAVVFLLRHYILKPCSKTKDPLPTALRPALVPKDGVHVKFCQRNNNKFS